MYKKITLLFFLIVFSFSEPLISVLSYHHLDLNPKFKTPYTVDSVKFIEQLDGLKEAGFSFVSLKDLEDHYYKHKPLPAKSAVITFDDGNHNTYTIAYPILKKRKIPFAVFVYPTAIGVGHDKSFANWAEIKEMSDNGVIIGCHAYDHPFVTMPGKVVTTKDQYDKWLKYELSASKQEIEESVGKSVDYFAVPFGTFDTYTYNKLKEAGYKLVFNVHGSNSGAYTDPLNINRVFVMKDDSVKSVVAKASALPIFFESTYPKDLERVYAAEFNISFKIKNIKEIKPETVQLLFGGNKKDNLTYDAKTNTFTSSVKVHKISYYGVSVVAEGKNGASYKGNWIFQYSKEKPTFL